MKRNDLYLMGEAYSDMLMEATTSYTAGSVKISLIKDRENNEWVIKWFDDGKENEKKSYHTDDKADAEHTFEIQKKQIIKDSMHENLNKPNAFIRRNVQSPVTHPFVLCVEKDMYPLNSVEQGKKLAGILRVRAAVQI